MKQKAKSEAEWLLEYEKKQIQAEIEKQEREH
jgi:hypothetical protein